MPVDYNRRRPDSTAPATYWIAMPIDSASWDSCSALSRRTDQLTPLPLAVITLAPPINVTSSTRACNETLALPLSRTTSSWWLAMIRPSEKVRFMAYASFFLCFITAIVRRLVHTRRPLSSEISICHTWVVAP